MTRFLQTLAVVQLVALLAFGAYTIWPSIKPAGPTAPVLLLGDTVTTLIGRLIGQSNDTVITLGDAPGGTVLLAFTSHCRWCDSVAPVWQAWLAADHRVRVLGITRDLPDTAKVYLDAKGWRIASLSAPVGGTGIEASLSGRTPEIFLFDSVGVLRYRGNGRHIGLIDSLSEAFRAR